MVCSSENHAMFLNRLLVSCLAITRIVSWEAQISASCAGDQTRDRKKCRTGRHLPYDLHSIVFFWQYGAPRVLLFKGSSIVTLSHNEELEKMSRIAKTFIPPDLQPARNYIWFNFFNLAWLLVSLSRVDPRPIPQLCRTSDSCCRKHCPWCLPKFSCLNGA